MPIAVRVVSQDQFDQWYSAAAENLEDANRALAAAIQSAKGEEKVAGLN